MTTNNSSSLSGHIKIVLVIFITLILPLSAILLSYLGYYPGETLAMYATATAVILSSAYLGIGTIVMAVQDSKDKQDSGE